MLPLIDALYGGAVLAAFVSVAFVIRRLCRRRPFRRLSLALTLGALAASVSLFRYLVPEAARWLTPYLNVIFFFAVAYSTFKVIEVVALDVLAVRRGWALPPAILRDIVSAIFAAFLLVVLLRSALGVDITALVATSAALSIVLGLALQETLAKRRGDIEDIAEPAAVREGGAPEGDLPSLLLGRIRRFFGLASEA
jgi:small-conductance mechanosensitive channel